MIRGFYELGFITSIIGAVFSNTPSTTPSVASGAVIRVNLPEPTPYSPGLHRTTRLVNLSPLEGMRLGNLNAWYLGIEGEAPDEAAINFAANLDSLWERKLDRGVTPATKDSFQRVLVRYRNSEPGLTTLPHFVEEVDSQVRLTHTSLNYDALCSAWDERVRTSESKEKHYLHRDGCSLLRGIMGNITGRDLVAYGMTELFPARNGERNVRLMNVLLPNAGSEYLNSLPALGDPLLSLGLYQFTSHAVRHDASGAHGASMISQYAEAPYQIPGSVVSLSGNDHHRAAFYFATYNIANWIRHSTPEERNKLRVLFPKHMDQIAQFMAVAHHLPGPAISRARKWVRHDGKRPLVKYLGPSLTIYANKTRSNRAALDEELGVS